MFVLRDYQKDAVEASVNYLKNRRTGNGICVCPTGSGKSLIIANIVKQLDAPTLIFQPSKEILEQNTEKMRSYGFEPNIFSASIGRKDIGEITFATIGSVRKVQGLFDHFPYLIIDECHYVNAKSGMYRDFIAEFNGKARVLGLTATPYRLATNSYGSELRFLTRTRPRIFKDLVYYCQNKTLFDRGYLCKLEYRVEDGFDRSKMRTNSTGADFIDKSVQRYYKKSGFFNRLCKTVEGVLGERRNCLVFTRFIEEAENLVKNVNGVEIVTGLTSKKERERILSEFRSGKIKGVTNVGVLTTGFDFPELEAVVLARPTMSLGLYYQMIGRGVRPHKDKKDCLVVDMCGNMPFFGRVEDLMLVDGGNGKWYISSRGRALTNVFLWSLFGLNKLKSEETKK